MTMLRVRTEWSGSGSAGSLSTHYFGPVSGAPNPLDVQACVDRIHNFWQALNAHIATGVVHNVMGTVDHINEINGQLVGSTGIISSAGTGTLSGDALPFQTQGVVRWTSSVIADGRRLRGHTFVPNPIETDNTAGTPIAAYVTALGTAAVAATAAGTYTLQIWHRPKFDATGNIVRNGSMGAVNGGTGLGSWGVLRSRR